MSFGCSRVFRAVPKILLAACFLSTVPAAQAQTALDSISLAVERVAVFNGAMPLATNGYPYLMANEFQRQPNHHDGHDLRVKPYVPYRACVAAEPVLLK